MQSGSRYCPRHSPSGSEGSSAQVQLAAGRPPSSPPLPSGPKGTISFVSTGGLPVWGEQGDSKTQRTMRPSSKRCTEVRLRIGWLESKQTGNRGTSDVVEAQEATVGTGMRATWGGQRSNLRGYRRTPCRNRHPVAAREGSGAGESRRQSRRELRFLRSCVNCCSCLGLSWGGKGSCTVAGPCRTWVGSAHGWRLLLLLFNARRPPCPLSLSSTPLRSTRCCSHSPSSSLLSRLSLSSPSHPLATFLPSLPSEASSKAPEPPPKRLLFPLRLLVSVPSEATSSLASQEQASSFPLLSSPSSLL